MACNHANCIIFKSVCVTGKERKNERERKREFFFIKGRRGKDSLPKKLIGGKV